MGFRANRAYLKDELQRCEGRFNQVASYLEANPAISLQERIISGHTYYYERFKKMGKSISRFYTKSPKEAKAKKNELNNNAILRKKLKSEKKELKVNINLLKRQIKIVDQGIKTSA
jgi:hypothetical protein